MRRLILATVACSAAIAFSAAQAAFIFTDWTNVDTGANQATGTLASTSVTFSGSDINFGVTDGSSTIFNDSGLFSPALASSDAVQFIADQAYTYTVSFGAPVTNPRIHLQSLASVLTFNTAVTEILGDLIVSGSTVTGAFPDVSGTIELAGTFSGFSFTTAGIAGVTIDGVNIQIGADIASVPEPGSVLLLLAGLAAMSLWPRMVRIRVSAMDTTGLPRPCRRN